MKYRDIILITILSLALSSEGATNSLPKTELNGTYYWGDGLGVNIFINIQSNHTYTGYWRGCLGIYGTTTGTWSFATNSLTLLPTEETNMLKDNPIRRFEVVMNTEAEPQLILTNSNSFFYGKAFIKRKA